MISSDEAQPSVFMNQSRQTAQLLPLSARPPHCHWKNARPSHKLEETGQNLSDPFGPLLLRLWQRRNPPQTDLETFNINGPGPVDGPPSRRRLLRGDSGGPSPCFVERVAPRVARRQGVKAKGFLGGAKSAQRLQTSSFLRETNLVRCES